MVECNCVLVETETQLEIAKRRIAACPIIGVDTEYDSFRYFRELLCLVQVGADSEAYLFDPFGDIDFSFLGDIFADHKILKVLHACDNDVRLLNRDYAFEFANLFDTHRAASLLGSTLLSLHSVLKEYLGCELNKEKKIQRSRWDLRPLAQEQLHYAARDAVCLIPLQKKLDEALNTQGLTCAASEAFEEMTAVRWRKKTLNRKGYTRIQGFEELNERGQERLKRLYYWRFEKASRINRARFMILSDDDLMELVRADIDTLDSLKRSGILSSRKVDEIGEEIIEALKWEHCDQ